MTDTTAADQGAEIALQANVIAEVDRANREELPLLGGPSGKPEPTESAPEPEEG